MPRLKNDIVALTCVALGGAMGTAATLAVLEARADGPREVRTVRVSSCATVAGADEAPKVIVSMRDGARSGPSAAVTVSPRCVTFGEASVIRMRATDLDRHRGLLDRDRARLERDRVRLERDLHRLQRERRSMEHESMELRRDFEHEAVRLRREMEKAVRADAMSDLQRRQQAVVRALEREMRQIEREASDARSRGGGR